jgi:sialic acid synthase SpsE
MQNKTPYIIAEIASSHEGDVDLAIQLVQQASQTGTDAIKLQIFNREYLISSYHEKYESFGEIELSRPEWMKVLSVAERTGVDIIMEVYDPDSLAFCETFSFISAYKIPTSDISNREFLETFADTGKPLYLGAGGATQNEIDMAVTLLKNRSVKKLVLMHGFQSYPTKLENTNLSRIPMFRHRYDVDVGMADHCDAEEHHISFMIPAMAYSMGASFIEKHITHDRSKRGRDHYSALNPDEFTEFVRSMKSVQVALGSEHMDLTPEEENYRRVMKRFAVMKHAMSAGMTLGNENVLFKRTGDKGISHADITNITGRRLKQDKQVDEPIQESDLD